MSGITVIRFDGQPAVFSDAETPDVDRGVLSVYGKGELLAVFPEGSWHGAWNAGAVAE